MKDVFGLDFPEVEKPKASNEEENEQEEDELPFDDEED